MKCQTCGHAVDVHYPDLPDEPCAEDGCPCRQASEMDSTEITTRLESLRQAIRAESISYGEISELQDLADYIEPGDVELLQWAGVPEFPDEP